MIHCSHALISNLTDKILNKNSDLVLIKYIYIAAMVMVICSKFQCLVSPSTTANVLGMILLSLHCSQRQKTQWLMLWMEVRNFHNNHVCSITGSAVAGRTKWMSRDAGSLAREGWLDECKCRKESEREVVKPKKSGGREMAMKAADGGIVTSTRRRSSFSGRGGGILKMNNSLISLEERGVSLRNSNLQ